MIHAGVPAWIPSHGVMNALQVIRRGVAAVVLCLFLAVPGPAAAEEAGERAELDQRIRQEAAALDRVRRGESSVLEELGKIEATLERKSRRLDTLNSRLRQREREVDRAAKAADEASAAFEKSRTALAGRVRALYKWQRAGTPFVLLNGEFSVLELMRRKRHLETVMGRDRALIRRLSRNVRRSRNLRTSLEARRRELSEERDAVAALRDDLTEEGASRRRILHGLQRERALRTRTLEELEQAAGRLDGIITGSEKGREPTLERAPAFAAAGGSLDLPVKGRIVSGFGIHKHPDLDVDVHRPGIDIVAPVGAEVRTVEGGRVLYADRLAGYGKMLIIDHGRRYYTVYGHLSKLEKAVGDRVERGERIAWVGAGAASGRSRLYFEVRKNGKPVDPVRWFRRSAARRR